jgi:hypothetical protein
MRVDLSAGNHPDLRTYPLSQDDSAANPARPSLDSLRQLTPDDWAVVAASTDAPSGPEADGTVKAPQPQLAFTVAADRESGHLFGSVTVPYLRQELAATDDPAYAESLVKSIGYLRRRGERAPDASRLIDVYA